MTAPKEVLNLLHVETDRHGKADRSIFVALRFEREEHFLISQKILRPHFKKQLLFIDVTAVCSESHRNRNTWNQMLKHEVWMSTTVL
jgi:hypothetical protein